MKIMYCITRSNWGGAQANIYGLIEDQITNNNQVILVVGETGELTRRVEKLDNVEIIYLSELKRSLSPYDDFRAVMRLRKIIRSHRPNILHLHSSKAGAVGRLATIGLINKPIVIFTAHGWAFTEGVGSKVKIVVYAYIEKFLAHFTDKIICVSKFDYDLAVKKKIFNSANQGIVIYNGVDTPTCITHSEKSLGKVIITMTARFDTQKNQLLLIQALGKLESFNYELRLIGDGPFMEKCKLEVVQYSLQEHIKFYGFRSDVDKILKNSDIFALITNYEGLPISIIEAMSFSLPIIASDVGGISEEVINGENGYLVANEANIIADKVRYLIENEMIRKSMGKKSKAIFLEKFQSSAFLTATNAVYLKLLS
ncbi:glycosyltransferase family 4 protein [Levilactobacillus brevis]|uniref:glycosyltransferase family 4 protein n=1 Tax=Levilactobacillus brevis TaxID=1580 RepID=UPI0021A791CF|nr:glycosyltransferase family 4 protein [Levilactobacillus brevis]MCT3574122.1 glycosyltransferase family 1 protein [Levilactobacillus brevis]